MNERQRYPLGTPEPRAHWPRIVVVIAKNNAIGALVGLAFAAALVATNTGGLYDLISGASDKITPVLLLAGGFAGLLGSLFAGVAIMFLHHGE